MVLCVPLYAERVAPEVTAGKPQLRDASVPDGGPPNKDVYGPFAYSSLESQTPMSASTTSIIPFPKGRVSFFAAFSFIRVAAILP